jgi:hypothetical protein
MTEPSMLAEGEKEIPTVERYLEAGSPPSSQHLEESLRYYQTGEIGGEEYNVDKGKNNSFSSYGHVHEMAMLLEAAMNGERDYFEERAIDSEFREEEEENEENEDGEDGEDDDANN